jgi:protein phosphatase
MARDNCAVISHVGDSRVYRLRRGVLEQLTRDHSFAEQMREWGETAPAAYSHLVTRALGSGGDPDLRTERLETGDRYLLCTDGLSGVIDGAELAERLGRGTAASCCRDLIDRAFCAGSSDNITAVVIEVESG